MDSTVMDDELTLVMPWLAPISARGGRSSVTIRLVAAVLSVRGGATFIDARMFLNRKTKWYASCRRVRVRGEGYEYTGTIENTRAHDGIRDLTIRVAL
jgi:hypothetical protein